MSEYYYLIADFGDGSYCVHWFKSKKLAEKLAEKEEIYWNFEGTVNTVLAKDLQVSYQDDFYEEDED